MPEREMTEDELLAGLNGAENTDRELWREREGDYYADSIFVTQSGGIGMNVGGRVIVMPIRSWFENAITGINPVRVSLGPGT